MTDSEGGRSSLDEVTVGSQTSFADAVLKVYLKASNSEPEDRFGVSVALASEALATSAEGASVPPVQGAVNA